ncbi:MAG: acyltransferase [Deltaproteobacteria bacterium]|nr:acyltransferase [Deltaproteobacteria bacterium]
MDKAQNDLTSHSVKKLNALTSLRFFAAAMIVLGHCHGVFEHTNKIAEIFALNQAVSFFFVLSGFILVYVYPTLNNPRDRGHFLLARVARIWPAHIASFLLLLILAPMTLHPTIRDSVPWIILANLFMVHSWIPLWNYFLSFNGVSWSISTEFFFYLCFPFLIYRWQQTWFKKLLFSFLLLLAIIAVVNAFQLPNEHWIAGLSLHALVYISPLARLFEFVMGMAIALAWRKTSHLISGNRITGSIMELAALALAVASTHYTPVLAYFPSTKIWCGEAGIYWITCSGSVIFFGLLIFVMALEQGWVSKILSWPFAVLLGEISYSVYLIHTILLRFYQHYRHVFSDIPGWILYTIYWILVLIISHLIWLFIERPIRRIIIGLWPKTPKYNSSQSEIDCNESVRRFPSLLHLLKAKSKWAVIFEILFVSSVSLMVISRIHQPLSLVSNSQAKESEDHAAWFVRGKTIFLWPIHNPDAMYGVNIDGIKIESDAFVVGATNDKPALGTSHTVQVPEGSESVLFIDLDAPAAGIFQAFWSIKEDYCENDSIKAPLEIGRNVIFLPIPLPAGQEYRLRIDPGTAPGKYRIRKIEIHATPSG